MQTVFRIVRLLFCGGRHSVLPFSKNRWVTFLWLIYIAAALTPPVDGQPPVAGPPLREVAVFNGQVQVPPGAQYHLSFDTTSNFTRARIAGNVQATGGAGNDIRVLIAKDQSVVYDSGRRRTVVFSIDANERAKYTLYFDNRFSLLSPKIVSGKVSIVTWEIDAERNTADANQYATQHAVASLTIQKLYATLKTDEQALGTSQLSAVPIIQIVKDRSPNAAAGSTPDWSTTAIRVNTGLFDLADRFGTEGDVKASDVLANVLAHELSHIFYRHPGYGSSGSMGVKGLLDELQGKTGLDRTQEMEADILGIRVACQAGFNPNGMLAFMEAAAEMEGAAGSFMRNHPSGIERLSYLRGEVAKCENLRGRQQQRTDPAATLGVAVTPGDSISPAKYKAHFTTTKGDFVVEVHRDWAPLGADRFYSLVKNGFFTDVAFFRVHPTFMVQFGISGNPKIAAAWAKAKIQDDPSQQSNARGKITYAMGGPNTRTTQLFINLADNTFLDRQNFPPFGTVIEGMDVIDQLYSGYGEIPTMGGSGPSPETIEAEGNAYLTRNFPNLDKIKTARIVMMEENEGTQASVIPAGRAECLRYQTSGVTLVGTVASHLELNGWWGLKLDAPLCTIADRSDPAGVAYDNITETQIVLFQNEDLKPYIGRRVTISGKLFPMVTGHHRTPVLIGVDSIQGSGSVATTSRTDAKKAPLAYLPATFQASVNVLPKPVERVTAQAWDKDPSRFFPKSDSYVSHMFNGPMDVMWVSCLTGYKITEAKSTTGSSVFPMDADDPKNPYWGVAVSESGRTNITIRCVTAK